MKKYFLFTALIAITGSLTAQTDHKTSSSKQEKKVITIKKSVDKDGNEVIEKKILEGDAIPKEEETGDHPGRTIRITVDSMGKEQKIIMDNNDGFNVFSDSRPPYSERTVVIKKNPDGSVEVKEKSGENFSGGMNIKVDSSEAKKPNIGVSLNEELKITHLVKDGAAEKAGLQVGDVLTHLDGTFINDYDHLKDVISKKKVGDQAELTYLRERKEMKSTITLKGGNTRVYFNR